MKQLKQKLTAPLIVALLNREEKFMIDTNDSDKQLGFVVLQEKMMVLQDGSDIGPGLEKSWNDATILLVANVLQ